jgi:hypothetical protein
MTTTTGGFALTHALLSAPPIHIPNRDGFPFKTDLVLERDPATRTVKLTWWHADDDRGDPHNHPWNFESTILFGGYTDERWVLGPDGSITHHVRVLRAGDVNIVPRQDFHRVFDVLPGTVTNMVTGPARPNNEWGYLNVESGVYTRATKDPDFATRLRDNNRFMKP